jgi:hypothetical protein
MPYIQLITFLKDNFIAGDYIEGEVRGDILAA